MARVLSERVVLCDAFLQPHFERGSLPQLGGFAVAHVHYHQQALAGRDSTASLLRAAGVSARVLDAGCCGMAGSFGYDKHH